MNKRLNGKKRGNTRVMGKGLVVYQEIRKENNKTNPAQILQSSKTKI